jgi:hypothetical protein
MFPFLVILLVCCTQPTYSGQVHKQGKKVMFKGNEIEFGEIKVIPYAYLETYHLHEKMFVNFALSDSVPTTEWPSGLLKMENVTRDTMPVAMNGQPIFGNEQQYDLSEYVSKYAQPIVDGKAKSPEEFLFTQLKKDLDQLEDGAYFFNINRIVIDEFGNVAYYENNGIGLDMGPDEKRPIINDNFNASIQKKLNDAMNNSLKFKPAIKDGKPVNVRIGLRNYVFVVKNHQARLVARGGC